MNRKSARQTIKRLHVIRNRYGAPFEAEKQALLGRLEGEGVRTAADVRRLHLILCFLRAFPDSRAIHERAASLLDCFSGVVTGLNEVNRSRLGDTGIAGTNLHYHFSFEVASWLSRRFPGLASIEWDDISDSSRFDELLNYLLHHSESDYFDSGHVSTEEWFRIAAGQQPGSDFDWLMSQLDDRRHHSTFWTALYNAAEIPLSCDLASSHLSKTHNVYPTTSIYGRDKEMHNRVHRAKNEIVRPLPSLKRLDRKNGQQLLDVAMSSLAVRHRETNHFNYANPDEVWVARVGRGVEIVATGLLPEHRYPLECTMGFLIISNGVPIGYGGSSMVFRQANCGINIFDEYRGSEAAWLWVQVMRVFHAISGCTRFIANPYQFGEDNPEALRSGAFWFYYRLGYRPVESEVRRLAQNEYEKIQKRKHYRTPINVLKELASCDMHLTLSGARKADFFDESWIEHSSLLATQQLAGTGQQSRRRAQDKLARRLVEELGIEEMDSWTGEERRWFVRMAPIVCATSPGSWLLRDRKSMIALLRSKGSRFERDYARRLGRHKRFFEALKKESRRVGHEA